MNFLLARDISDPYCKPVMSNNLPQSLTGAYTNRGPLTTTFTPPASCISTATQDVGNQGFVQLFVNHWGTEYFDSACWPQGRASSVLGRLDAWTLYYCKSSSGDMHCKKLTRQCIRQSWLVSVRLQHRGHLYKHIPRVQHILR